MKRRNFLKGTLGAAIVASFPLNLGKFDGSESRIVEIDSEDGWIRVEMQDLKSGDVFRLREPNGSVVVSSAIADGEPFKNQESGVWGIQVKM